MRNIRILYYHRIEKLSEDYNMLAVSPENFDAQMQYICSHYDILNLSDSYDVWDKQGTGDGVIITFDDGYYDLLYNALPVLERYQIPATMFITTGHIGTEEEFWHDNLHRALFEGKEYKEYFTLEDDIYGGTWATDCLQSKVETYAILRKLFQMAPCEKRAEYERQLLKWAGITEKGRKNRRTLEESELLTLAQSPYVTIGAHCVSHPSLRWLCREQQRMEILESKSALERMTGKEIKLFSYPFGSRDDYSEITIDILRQANFDKAVVAFGGGIYPDTDAYQMPRYLVRNYGGDGFKAYMEEVFGYKKKMDMPESNAQVEYIGKFEADKIVFRECYPIVIWGTGINGRGIYRKLAELGMQERILAFADNDGSKCGNVVEGIPVYSEEGVIHLCDKQRVIILVKNVYGWEICAQLTEKNVRGIHLLIG